MEGALDAGAVVGAELAHPGGDRFQILGGDRLGREGDGAPRVAGLGRAAQVEDDLHQREGGRMCSRRVRSS